MFCLELFIFIGIRKIHSQINCITKQMLKVITSVAFSNISKSQNKVQQFPFLNKLRRIQKPKMELLAKRYPQKAHFQC